MNILTLLKIFQEDFTKWIVGFSDMDYNKRLQILKLTNLQYRRLRGDLIEIYKIIHGLYDSKTINSLFTYDNDTRTRVHPYKIFKIYVRTSRFGHCILVTD